MRTHLFEVTAIPVRLIYRPLNSSLILRLVLGLVLLTGMGLSRVEAGGIAGTIRDANTNVPLVGIDLDVFDVNFNSVTGVNDSSDEFGDYLLSPLPAGDYYLRADPSLSEGYVDQYYPGVFLKSGALPITVGEFGTVVVDFYLEQGGTISGHIRDVDTLLPLSSIDLDIYAWDRSYIPSVNAATDASGNFTLGCLPPGDFFVRADPDSAQWYVRSYYNGKGSRSTADPITVTGVGDIPNIDFDLILGGTVGGTIRSAVNGMPLSGIDIDVFDSMGNFVAGSDATTDAAGSYWVGATPPGVYYVQADPTPVQGYVDTYYGGAYNINLAVPVTITALTHTDLVDIDLPLGGTISGIVTNSETGQPLSGTRLTIFDELGSILVGAGGNTNADGSFLIGAVPTGDYLVRCNGDVAQELAFEFYPGVILKSMAAPIPVTAGSNSPGINFSLNRGGWITGTVRADDTGDPMVSVDMDVFATDGEFIGALDADTGPDGSYTLGPCPFLHFAVEADPMGIYPYQPQFYDHVPTLFDATRILVSPSEVVDLVDFDLLPQDPAGLDGNGIEVEGARVLQVGPNPWHEGDATISFELNRAQRVRLELHDVSGRRVGVLADGRFAAGHYEIPWSRTGIDSGAQLGSGLLFLRLETEHGLFQEKISILR